MKNDIRRSQSDDQKIQEIIIALGTYALGDIKYNIYGPEKRSEKYSDPFDEQKPIAAFILCSCFIDQMAAFAYNTQSGDTEDNYKRFIRGYLPVYYQPLNLYTELRNLIIHGYSVGEHISLTIENELKPIDTKNISSIHISANRFYEDLKQSFEKLKQDLLTDTEIRRNALGKFDNNPPLTEVKHRFLAYTRKGADYLVSFFKNKLIGKFLNNNQAWRISNVTKYQYNPPETKYFVQCVAIFSQHRHVAHLDKITQQEGLPYPIAVLNNAGLSTEYSLIE